MLLIGSRNLHPHQLQRRPSVAPDRWTADSPTGRCRIGRGAFSAAEASKHESEELTHSHILCIVAK